MADTVKKVNYFKITTSNKPGQGAKILGALKNQGVNLISFSGFPRGGKAQMDFVPENTALFKKAAQKAGIKLGAGKSCFVVQGKDRAGAIAEIMSKLAKAKINVTALDGISAGKGRYAAILWVKPQVIAKAAKALGAS